MTPDLLRRVGEALYGPRWRSEMAHGLGVTYRTMRRWVAGEYPVPPGVRAELHALVAARLPALADIERELDAPE